MASLPLVGLPTDRKILGPHPSLVVGEKYARAVVDGAGCLPLLLPSMQPALPVEALLGALDGLLLTGAQSNVEPHHYGTEPSYEGNLHDPGRDATTLALIPAALRMGVPVLAICRGFQEANVALGGSLYQKVQDVPGFMDHREDPTQPLDVQYGPAHDLALVPGGWLAQVNGGTATRVNSLHGQGVNRLAPGLRVEATAPDGLVEAFRADDGSFLLGLQFHPEWKVTENPFYLGIFRLFGDACRRRAAQRAAAGPHAGTRLPVLDLT